MSDYTAPDVEAAIKRAMGTEDSSWGEVENWRPAPQRNWKGEVYSEEDLRLVLDIDGQKEYAEFIDGKMPREGGGEDVWIIVGVGTQLFRKYGYYASHYGTDWDGSFEEVTPVEKVITVYNAK